jgi:hypothetical protein
MENGKKYVPYFGGEISLKTSNWMTEKDMGG